MIASLSNGYKLYLAVPTLLLLSQYFRYTLVNGGQRDKRQINYGNLSLFVSLLWHIDDLTQVKYNQTVIPHTKLNEGEIWERS